MQHHRTTARSFQRSHAAKLVEEWITSAGLPAGQATWTGLNGTVLTEAGTITTTTSGGTNPLLVFPGTSGNYMSKTDGIGPLPSGSAERTVVVCASFDLGRFCGFSWGAPGDFQAFTLGVQGGGLNTISADYYNAFSHAEDDVVSNKGLGIYFLTLISPGIIVLYHGDQLVMTDVDLSLNTGTDRINLMRPYSGTGTPAGGQIGYIGVYDGPLDASTRQAVVDRLKPLYFGTMTAPVATSLTFVANSPTTGSITATLPTWRSVAIGVVTTSATKPTAAQIKAGLNHLGNPTTPFTLGPALTASAAVESGPIGLTPGVTNYPHYLMKDAYGTEGTVQTGTAGATPSVAAPTAITPTAISFPETVIAPMVVTTLVADSPSTFTKTSGNAAFTVASNGNVTLISNLTAGSYSFVALATNAAGTFSATVNVTATAAAAAADLAVRFGALTPTGSGGAQARNATGDVVNFTSISSQPASRWAITSGRLVYTGTGGMVSEQITAVVAGATVAVNITVVANMTSVKDSTEFAAVSMTPVGTGDLTIHLRAETVITAAAANSKLAGTSGAIRTLGGTLTLTGELVRGVPSANIDGKFRLKFFSGGAVVFRDCNLSPSGTSDQSFQDGPNSALIECSRSATTDFILDGIHTVGNPAMLTWPGKTANNGTNDWGHDTWGALVRVNGVSGVSRPYVDGQVTVGGKTGPDIMTFTGSGIKRVLMGIHALGGGVYELHVGDKGGNYHSIPTSSVSGDHTASLIKIGDTVSGLDGFAATVIAPPSTGVDDIGASSGRYAGEAAYTYLIRGPQWYNTPDGNQNSGTANTVRNLTVRNCYVRCVDEAFHTYAIQKVTIEQNRFGYFTRDLFKVGNPVANPNFEAVVRRNDFFMPMQSPADLGAEHNDFWQFFGPDPQPATGGDWKVQFHHNRIFDNGRGGPQGFWMGQTTPCYDSNVFGNVWVIYNGGNALSIKLRSNSVFAHNTILVHAKEASLPLNWAPGGGLTMAATISPFAPATQCYSGWNAIKRFTASTILTEKNFGLLGNTSIEQDALFVGLAAVKPARPWFFETYDEVMLGARVKLTGADDKVGALGSNSNWAGYPNYVTTDFSHITHADFTAPVYDPGVPSTLALTAPTATGGVLVYTGGVTVGTPGGGVYYVVYPSAGAEPSAAQIQAGLKADNTAATSAGTLGASTAGAKTISSTAIIAGIYKISYVQVVGSTVSPVVTSSAVSVASGAGITGITSEFTHSDTTASASLREGATFTPTAGAPLFFACGILNQSALNREIATVATFGTPGRGAGTGTVLTPIAHGYDSRGTIKVYRVNNPSAVSSSFQIAFNDGTNADTCGGIEIFGFRVNGGNTTEAVGVVAAMPDDPTNGTTIVPTITTATNGSIAVYCAVAPSGASGTPTITTTGATEIYNHSTGSSTSEADATFAVAWEAAATAGVYTCTFTRSATGTRYGVAFEVNPS
jgi:hypothetical protein